MPPLVVNHYIAIDDIYRCRVSIAMFSAIVTSVSYVLMVGIMFSKFFYEKFVRYQIES
jgi:hypothetical protein